jgi:hypothetical protein
MDGPLTCPAEMEAFPSAQSRRDLPASISSKKKFLQRRERLGRTPRCGNYVTVPNCLKFFVAVMKPRAGRLV